MNALAPRLGVLVRSAAFQNTTLALIVANALLMGLETSSTLMDRWGAALIALNITIQALFVVEIALRVGAHGSRPLEFFRDGWNVFDFLVVAVSLLPAAGAIAGVARVARVLRVARLVSAMPELRLIVGTMLRSIPSMGHVVALLALLLYVYGVIGFHMFSKDAPAQWGSLPVAFQSLFQVLTLEGWVEIQDAVLPSHPWAWAFFASFIVIAVFVVINLFIAVVINNLEAARKEEEDRRSLAEDDESLRCVAELREQLQNLERALRARRAEPAASGSLRGAAGRRPPLGLSSASFGSELPSDSTQSLRTSMEAMDTGGTSGQTNGRRFR